MGTDQASGQAVTTKRLFSRETVVSIDINADPTTLWKLLTNASDYPRWNTTIISIEGTIAPQHKIKLKAQLDPKRVFALDIIDFQPEHTLVWGDAMGKRTYTLQSKGNKLTTFTMHEKIGGPLFPLFAGMIPSFDDAFNQFAHDLKKEAEKNN